MREVLLDLRHLAPGGASAPALQAEIAGMIGSSAVGEIACGAPTLGGHVLLDLGNRARAHAEAACDLQDACPLGQLSPCLTHLRG